jgi:site-specific DNA-methyltransferase (adenine-specific)
VSERFLNDRVELHCGDCLDVLARLEENSIDSCCCDPPYHLTSIVQRFGAENAPPVKTYKENGGTGAAFARMSKGFMGKVWDGGDIAFRPETWASVYRVLKPGAHLVAFGGTRTFHRLACAIDDAGFEVRDTLSWIFGSGFPKSHDVSKGIDRAAGAERQSIGKKARLGDNRAYPENATSQIYGRDNGHAGSRPDATAPATDAARQWEGWGTALKPACELIVLARKPLSEGTVAANVLRWGCGAINVDGCRVSTDETIEATRNVALGSSSGGIYGAATVPGEYAQHTNGRWPANVVLSDDDEVRAAFPDAPGQGGSVSGGEPSSLIANVYGERKRRPSETPRTDAGSAARFFYTAKADADDRLGSKHPTVKPLDLMQWLVRLVTPKGGTVLDPFAGTGTTGEAAWREGMRAVLIEREAEYQADIRRRMKLALSGPDERIRESIKAKNLPRDDGPLFAALADDYNPENDFARSIEEAYRVIRERKANGGKGWGGWE